MFQSPATANFPAIDGYLVYQQGFCSTHTMDRIWRNGLLQFFIDADPSHGAELNFREPANFYNAQFIWASWRRSAWQILNGMRAVTSIFARTRR